MRELPAGTVTFLFTDMEGSTRLLQELGDEYPPVLAEHRRVLRAAFAENAGVEVDTQGDAFFVAFARATDAAAAAVMAQESFGDTAVRIRMGLHTGEPMLTDEGYVGLDVHRAARIAACGHGGQILLSQTTRDLLANGDVRDLGEHRLKDLSRPERIWQLGAGDFPALKSLNRTNLPFAASPLVGRAADVAEIERLIRTGTRLLTLTGAGGSGKTRLAIQAAAELVDDFAGGSFFVALAPLRDAALVPGAVSQALGVAPDEDVRAHLESNRVLLVFDNAEHIPGVAETIAQLLGGKAVFLVTSRAPLRVSAEREFPVEPLAPGDAAQMFADRAEAVGRPVPIDDDVRAVCRRLDNLPLALELAAARVKLLSPSALRMRLDRALPILTDGARDAPARQQTLRATIDWSHELLSVEARTLLRRLAVFRGSFTLEAAETVGDADLDTLGELVDESLLKSVGADRFLLLETIREYALERLRDAGEEEELVRRHGGFYLERMQAIEPLMRGHRMDECLRWYDAEAQNIRAALDGLLAVGEAEHAFTLADITSFFWISRVNTREGASWLEHALSVASEPTRARGRAMTRLADMFVRLGRPIDSEQLLREAVEIAERTDDSRGLATAFRLLGTAASDRGDRVAALEHARNARRVAMQTDDPLLRAIVTADLGILLNRTEDGAEEGQELLHEVLAFRRQIGDRPNEGGILFALGERKLTDGEFDAAKPYLLEVAEIGQELGGELLAVGFVGLALHALLTDARGDALEYAREALQVVSGLDSPLVNLGVAEVAAIVGRTMHPGLAVRVLGAGFGIRERHGREIDPVQKKLYGPFVAELREQLGDDEYEREHTAGAAMTLDEALALAETILS